jgi:hypothetical protein
MAEVHTMLCTEYSVSLRRCQPGGRTGDGQPRSHPRAGRRDGRAAGQSRSRKLSGVNPASRTIPAIVNAFTGFLRGTVRMRVPSDMTTCLPCRRMENPALSSARMASRWFTPGIPGTSGRNLHFADLRIPEQVVTSVQVLPDCLANVREGLHLCFPLRPTPRQSGDGNGIPFIRTV